MLDPNESSYQPTKEDWQELADRLEAPAVRLQNKVNKLFTALEKKAVRVSGLLEGSRINSKTLEKYRCIYSGRDVVLLATGHTLNQYIPIPGAVHIGVNLALFFDKVQLDHHIWADYRGFKKWKNLYEEIKSSFFAHTLTYMSGWMTIFPKSPFEEYVYHWGGSEDVFPLFERVGNEVVDIYTLRANEGIPIAPDFSRMPISDFTSVIFHAMQFALLTNPRRIYIVGCDMNMTVGGANNHFVDRKINYGMPPEQCTPFHNARYHETLHYGWREMRQHCKQYFPNLEIVSINPVGLRGFFDRDVFSDAESGTYADEPKDESRDL